MSEGKAPRRNPRESTGRSEREPTTRGARSATARAGIKSTRAADVGARPPVSVDPSPAMNPPAGMTEEVRRQIEEAAYYRAQQRGFAPGYELDDWIAAEAEVMRRNGVRS